MEKRTYIIRGRKVPIKIHTFGYWEAEAGTNANIKGVPGEESYIYFCIRKKTQAPGKGPILLKHLFIGNPLYFTNALRFIANAIESQMQNNFNITESEIEESQRPKRGARRHSDQ